MSLSTILKRKHKRSIQRDIDLIFSMKGITTPKTIEDYKRLGFFAPRIQTGKRSTYLSSEGVQALRRICTIIYESQFFKELLSYHDIYKGVSDELGFWIERQLIPEGEEFIEPLYKRLSGNIKEYSFICRIEGISQKNIQIISIGNRCIRKFSQDLISDFTETNDFVNNIVESEYAGSLVIIGSERGSETVAKSKFYENSELSLSILRLYSCSHYTKAIKRTNIRLMNNCAHAYGPASCLSWEEPKKNLGATRYFISDQELALNHDFLSYLRKECFFKEIAELIDKTARSELEESIIKSLYWLGEAQKDNSNASSWVKLWSSLECFFTLGEDEVTERNARGIASVILYGGYIHDEYRDYNELKKKIKDYYSLRSKIVHRAEYRHIDDILLIEFSYLVSWVIITMASLMARGYTNLDEVKAKVDLSDKKCLTE